MLQFYKFFYEEKVLKTFFYSLIFVGPIYCVHFFEIFDRDPYSWLITLLALGSVAIFFLIPSSKKFWFGFFVGLLWFYWVGFSFFYFGAPILVPVIAVVVAGIYMLLFVVALYYPSYIWRGVWLVLLGYIHPFGFDWLLVDSFFAYSYFGVQKYDFILIVLGIAFILQTQDRKQIVGIAFLICALDYHSLAQKKEEIPFDYALLGSSFSQDFKWQRQNMQSMTKEQLTQIQTALKEKKKLIILPETAFPFEIEKSYFWEILNSMSSGNTLIVGSLREGENGIYNSAYIFSNLRVSIADKKILAPFGEKIPLPDFLSSSLRHFFLGNSPKILEGEKFSDINIEGKKVRVLICYEGTSQEAYENAPKYLIVISNNAWFKGSIEPSVQKMLMKYYAKRYNKIILHAINGSRSFVMT
nr:apolipoprotein N-acyltransferase [Helicobacter cholecystus]